MKFFGLTSLEAGQLVLVFLLIYIANALNKNIGKALNILDMIKGELQELYTIKSELQELKRAVYELKNRPPAIPPK
jgi:hypothetical protein